MRIDDKDVFHKDARQRLQALADELGLKKGTYEIRSNKAGPAIPGDVVLHGEWIYVSVGGSYWDVKDFYVRTCKGRKDYTGGPNNVFPIEDLFGGADAIEELGTWLRRTLHPNRRKGA